jgi:hypothetical protein
VPETRHSWSAIAVAPVLEKEIKTERKMNIEKYDLTSEMLYDDSF